MEVALIIEKLAYFFEKFGYLAVFWGSFIEISPLGWAVPGGTILAIAGFFANTESNISIISVIAFGTLGAWFTFLISYFLGKKSGMWLVNKLKQQKNASVAKNMLKKHGAMILTTSMLANLTRFWIAYIAGVEKYSPFKFILYSFLASLSWVSLMTLLGYFAGYERQNLEQIIGSLGIISWMLLGLAILVIGRSIKQEYQYFKKDTLHKHK